LGPWFVDAADVADPSNLNLRTYVNGKPTQSGNTPRDDINSVTEQLQFNLVRARSQFQSTEADKQIRRSSTDGGPTATDLRRLMDCVLWSAADRARLYNSARDLGQSSAKSAIEQAGATKPGSDAAPAVGQRTDSAAWRARLAIDLLRLDGLTDTRPLDEMLDRAARENKPAKWEEVGDAIRRAWAVALPAVAGFYMAATIGSAVDYHRGRGVRWKQRDYQGMSA